MSSFVIFFVSFVNNISGQRRSKNAKVSNVVSGKIKCLFISRSEIPNFCVSSKYTSSISLAHEYPLS